MEFLNGGDLFSLLHALNAFEEEMAKFYIAECVLALEYLHERKIVHRGTFFYFSAACFYSYLIFFTRFETGQYFNYK